MSMMCCAYLTDEVQFVDKPLSWKSLLSNVSDKCWADGMDIFSLHRTRSVSMAYPCKDEKSFLNWIFSPNRSSNIQTLNMLRFRILTKHHVFIFLSHLILSISFCTITPAIPMNYNKICRSISDFAFFFFYLFRFYRTKNMCLCCVYLIKNYPVTL